MIKKLTPMQLWMLKYFTTSIPHLHAQYLQGNIIIVHNFVIEAVKVQGEAIELCTWCQ